MTKEITDRFSTRLVAVIPAAGYASRLAPLPGSKELFPIGFMPLPGKVGARPKVACHYLLECLRYVGVRQAYIVLRQGKWDIPAFLGDGSTMDMHLAYLMMGPPHGAPFTLDQAFPFVQDAIVALGFPDILFEPADAFLKILQHLKKGSADVVLGLFPAADTSTVDMVAFDDKQRIYQIEIKPSKTHLNYTWGIAVWTPAFTHYMHAYLSRALEKLGLNRSHAREWFVGDVLQAAIDNGIKVEGLVISDKPYIDIGTPENLMKAVRQFAVKGA